MPARKKKSARAAKNSPPRKAAVAVVQNESSGRQRRSDDEKLRLVQQVLASGNQSAEIKKLGIYPNQFYAWKKKHLGVGAEAAAGRGRKAADGGRSAADEAKTFIQGKAALLERLRSQRSELNALIEQLQG